MRRIFMAIVAAAVCLTPSLRAQEQAAAAPPPPSMGLQGHVGGILIPVIPGAPFSGKLLGDLTGKWADGTTVRSGFFNLIARDSLGRVHQERRHIEPPGSSRASELTRVTIWDTPKRTMISCDVSQHSCVMTWFLPRYRIYEEPEGLSRDGKTYLTREKMGTAMLGDQQVELTRETITTNAGAEGNDRPLVSTREFWYSPTLKINLSVRRTCACGTVQDLHVVDLLLGEPNPAMFTPPAGYTMVDLRTPRVNQQR